MSTIDEFKSDKISLERNIINAIQDFEDKYSASVKNVDLYKNHTIGCKEGKTSGIKIEVDL